MLVDYGIFMNVPPLDAHDLTNDHAALRARRTDPRFPPAAGLGGGGSRDGHSQRDRTLHWRGAGLGALEVGMPVPQYGPRFNPWWL